MGWVGKQKSMKILWFRGRFYNHYFVKDKFVVRYSPYLRDLSHQIIDEMFDSKFSAFHIRLGDYADKAKSRMNDGSAFVLISQKWNIPDQQPLYVATDAKKEDTFFEPLSHHFSDIYYQSDLLRNRKVRALLTNLTLSLPASSIRNDVFGLVEQLMCSQSTHFVGSLWSTFV